MQKDENLGISTSFEVIKVKSTDVSRKEQPVPTEVPFTIMVNDTEMATMQASPADLKELTYGFLFTSGMIKSASDIISSVLDPIKWIMHTEMEKTPDSAMTAKRLFTSGCGKGVMYSNITDLAMRHPIESKLTITKKQINDIAAWLHGSSRIYNATGGIHTAGISIKGDVPPESIDDIGRHNAVDKVIGGALIAEAEFIDMSLVTSGRVSSEILQKARRCNMPIIIARSSPTHQSVLKARDMGISLVGYARGNSFTIYSHEERVILD